MTSPRLKIKFFSFVKFVKGSGRSQYLLFHMYGHNHAVSFTQLRFFCGFHSNLINSGLRFNGGYNVDDFWELIIGCRGFITYNVRTIKHLIIYYIQRALVLTIFARGDNIDEVTIDEMELLITCSP
jgi:ATHILA ORF-1 family